MTTPTTDTNAILTAVRRFAVACDYEQQHAEQVTRLAETLFDALQPLHKLDASGRLCLTCAGLLHDIGWLNGQKGHHKRSMEMILDEPTLPLSPVERATIALTARYHRKALPKPWHTLYASLSRTRRKTVDILAAILRVADGLDRSHTDAVCDVEIVLSDNRIEFLCRCRGNAGAELKFAKKKADLLERLFGRTAVFTQAPIKSESSLK